MATSSHKLVLLLAYIISIASMILAVALLIFSFYLIPHVFLDIYIGLPKFILNYASWLEANLGLSGTWLKIAICFPFVMAGILLFFISRTLIYIIEYKNRKLREFYNGEKVRFIPRWFYVVIFLLLIAIFLYFTWRFRR